MLDTTVCLTPAGWRLVDDEAVPVEWVESYGDRYVMTARELTRHLTGLRQKALMLQNFPEGSYEAVWAELEIRSWEEAWERSSRPAKYA